MFSILKRNNPPQITAAAASKLLAEGFVPGQLKVEEFPSGEARDQVRLGSETTPRDRVRLDAQISVDSARNHYYTARGWDNLPHDLDRELGTYSRSERYGFEQGSKSGSQVQAKADFRKGHESLIFQRERLHRNGQVREAEEAYYRKQDGFEICGYNDFEGRRLEVVVSPNGSLTVFS